MDFSSSTDTNLYVLVVKINSVIFNFTLLGGTLKSAQVPEINIKPELSSTNIRLNQY